MSRRSAIGPGSRLLRKLPEVTEEDPRSLARRRLRQPAREILLERFTETGVLDSLLKDIFGVFGIHGEIGESVDQGVVLAPPSKEEHRGVVPVDEGPAARGEEIGGNSPVPAASRKVSGGGVDDTHLVRGDARGR